MQLPARIWTVALVTAAASLANVGGVACDRETGPEAPASAALGRLDAGGATATSGPVDAAVDAGSSAACARPCTGTAECACGRDRASGQCAVGRAECIDTSSPCPDFCTGIDGRRWTACINGACTTTRTR